MSPLPGDVILSDRDRERLRRSAAEWSRLFEWVLSQMVMVEYYGAALDSDGMGV